VSGVGCFAKSHNNSDRTPRRGARYFIFAKELSYTNNSTRSKLKPREGKGENPAMVSQ